MTATAEVRYTTLRVLRESADEGMTTVSKFHGRTGRWSRGRRHGTTFIGSYYTPSSDRLFVTHLPAPANVAEMMEARLTDRQVIAMYRKALPAILTRLELPVTIKARWSRTAGCGCGCSPGFILSASTGRDHFARIPGGAR